MDSQKKPKTKDDKDLLVQEGDLITCDFTEYIWTIDSTGNLSYAVYQTTLKNIAEDESIPKSITFQKILTNETGGSITRERLTAIVGPDLESEMNIGFKQLIMNMKEGEEKKGEIAIVKGYGERNESLVQRIPLKDRIPLYETIDRMEFESLYPEEVPLQLGQSIKHHFWSWYVKISSLTSEEVVIRHEPEVGSELEIFPWPVIVDNISDSNGYIWLQHKPTKENVFTPIDAEVLAYYNPTFTEIQDAIVQSQQPYPGIILSIQNGIEIDFNRENIGKNLQYEVKIIKIERD
jgi:FKBP-type peptidyl-prolyl cis-trans isomerase 2